MSGMAQCVFATTESKPRRRPRRFSPLSRGAFLAGLLASSAVPLPALAQSAGDQDHKPASGMNEEIVVTAERRQTKLQETPIAVSVLTPEMIEANHIQTLDDVALRAPSVTYVALNKGEAYVSIRGTLVNTPGAGWDDAVTTFIDDVPMTGVGDNSPDLFDLSSIEILRGPQGTLFGRNVTGGAIVIHTMLPSFDPEGQAELTYGSDNLTQFRGFVSGPLVDGKLAGKLTVDENRRDDYVENITLHDRTYGDERQDVRAQFLWTPSETVKVLLGGDYLKDTGSGKVVQLEGNFQPSLYPKLSYDPQVTNQGFDSPNNKTVYGLNARADWTGSWAELTSITGYRHVHDVTTWDQLGDPTDQALETSVVLNDQVTEEVHLASLPDQKLVWLGGLFFLHADKRETDGFQRQFNPGTAFAAGFAGGAFSTGGPLPGARLREVQDQNITDDTYAVFGEATYPLLDEVKLTLGARYSWESKSGQSSDTNSSPIPIAPLNPPAVVADYSHSWDAFTPKATLSYQPMQDLLTYATVAKGFKSGGYDVTGTTSAALAKPFSPETVWSYELGEKFAAFDHRLVLDAAAFLARYSNMQTQQLNVVTGAFQTSNAGKASVSGIELEALGQPLPWLTLGANYAYSDARYTDYVRLNPGGAPSTVLTGNRIPTVPRQNIHLTVDTTFDLEPLPGSIDFGLDYTYRSKVYYDDANSSPPFVQDGSTYDGIVNFHTTWKSDNENYSVSLWGKNITNEHTNVFGNPVTQFFATPAEAKNPKNQIYLSVVNPGRVFGVSLDAKF